MSRRAKRFAALGLITALAVAGAACWVWNGRSLMQRAVRVPGVVGPAYAWRTDRTLFYFPIDSNKTTRAVLTDATNGLQADRLDINGTLLQRKGYRTGNWSASPNGKWLLGLIRSEDSWYGVEIFAFASDGSQRFRWPIEHGYSSGVTAPVSAVWLPDSRRWLALTHGDNGDRLTLYSADAPDYAQVPVETPQAAHWLLGVTPGLRVVLTDFFPHSAPPPKSVNLYEVSLYPNPAPPSKTTVALPPGAELREIALAPQGDRLAWTFAFPHAPSAWIKFLARFLPAYKKRAMATRAVGLFLSRADGREMRALAYEESDPAAPPGAEPHAIRWTPDGKRLSFLSKSALYTVPAD